MKLKFFFVVTLLKYDDKNIDKNMALSKDTFLIWIVDIYLSHQAC